MTERKNDLAPLFKHFGQNHADYQELSSDAGAQDASERWPLIRNIPLQSQRDVPVLSDDERNNRLGKTVQNLEDIAPPTAKTTRAKLGLALNHLGDIRRTEVVRSSVAPLKQEEQVQDEGRESLDSLPAKSQPVSESSNQSLFHKEADTDLTPNSHLHRPEAERKKTSGSLGNRTASPQMQSLKSRTEPERKKSGLFGKGLTVPQSSQVESRVGNFEGLWERIEQKESSSSARDSAGRAAPGSSFGGLFGRRKKS